MAALNAETLKSSGAFISDDLVKKQVEWMNDSGEELVFDVYVKRMSYANAVLASDGSITKERRIAEQISDCIRSEDGDKIFTPDIIMGTDDDSEGSLHSGLTIALLGVIQDVNQGKVMAKLAPAQKKNSGTN